MEENRGNSSLMYPQLQCNSNNVCPPSAHPGGQSGQLAKKVEKHIEIQEALSFLDQSIDRLEGLYEMITGKGKPGATQQGCPPNSVLCLASTLDQSSHMIRHHGERIYKLADALREALF